MTTFFATTTSPVAPFAANGPPSRLMMATTFRSSGSSDGLLLSSGIVPTANVAMEQILATVEGLRLHEGYTGSIHLTLTPGASYEYIERAVKLADLVSLNLKAPNQARRNDLAPDKEFSSSMWGRMARASAVMRRARQEGRQVARSLTTGWCWRGRRA